ncbi:MAG: folylpolyglutamate synthase/dihydrofolate synthase family protein [Lactobacillus sp.]|nr:folylpolyglutamate synthase/dihydrofolate synthase family protein [Lactobacillus sp.]
MNFTDLDEFLNYLYALPRLHQRGDLSKIKQVLNLLGNPQNKMKTVHITGTNGKGSTAYYISNLLTKTGHQTGLFVSPYIRQFNERIQLNGQAISDHDLLTEVTKVEKVLAQIRQEEPDFQLVVFEYEVVLAFLYFYDQRVDYAVIEVGIGGEHDKTNVIIPELSVITTVAMDHEQIIGPTLADIAIEKSGIIKQKRPVIIGKMPASVKNILLKKAKGLEAPIFELGQDFQLLAEFADKPLVEQYDVAMAIEATKLLKIALSEQQEVEIIRTTKIPGRYQVVQTDPLIVLDGGHNPQAIAALMTELRQKHPSKIKVLLGMMKDKKIEQVLQVFSPQEEIYLTRIDYHRAAEKTDFPTELQSKFDPDYWHAYSQLKASLKVDEILVVTGSFYLVSAILQGEEDAH